MIDLAALNDPIHTIGVFDDQGVRLGFGPAWPTPNGFWMPVYVAGKAVHWRAVCRSGKIINGANPDIIGQIANSGLPANEMENLYKFATNEGGIQDDQRYGPGYAAAFRQVLSSPDDPSHVASAADIIADIRFWEQEVHQEEQAKARATGQATGNRFYIRHTR